MWESRDKGGELEQQISSFFNLNGYSAKTNVYLQGRSGATHEIDVFAEKSDGITDFKMIVECKAWETAIEKDIVAKLSMVMADLGIHKGIIVALKGWAVGAELTAKQLGIELWGPEEIQRYLGQVAVAQIQHGKATKTAMHLPLRISLEQATPTLLAQSKGILGFGKEEVGASNLAWIPFFLFHLSFIKVESSFFKRGAAKATRGSNLYEGLTGTYFTSLAQPVTFQEGPIGAALPRKANFRKIQIGISNALKKYHEVVTESAKQRHAARLSSLGIPSDINSLQVENVEDVYLPFYIALLHRAGKQRMVAVDGIWGKSWPRFESVLTANLSYVLQSMTSSHQDN